jgi:hypothetical protein
VPGEAVTDLEVLVEDTLLSVVVTNLADSPTAALVRDSGGRVHFLLVASLVAEITAALVTVVPVDAVATFAILPGTLFDLGLYGFGYPDYYPYD